jgi:amino acid permease
MTKLKKTLGLFDGIALLVGITIGAGIFKTPQVIASYINSFSIVIILWLSVAVFVFDRGINICRIRFSLPSNWW